MAEFYPSLQTQFNARLDSPTLQQLRIFGFRWARMDCQTCDVDTMLAMIADAKAHQLTPLPIVYDLERLEHLAAGADVEWGNEPDGDIWPTTYRDGLNAACAVAHSRGLVLWAPAISNLDRDSLLWLEAVRGAGWPDGLHGISAHRYGDGTFAFSHPGFPSRDAEVDRLLELCDGLPYIITEFGYPTKAVGRRGRLEQRSLTEAKQAECIAQEWDFWRRRECRVPILYQINDGIHADEGYGIRRCEPDGTLDGWKAAAYGVPKENAMDHQLAGLNANTVFLLEDLIAIPGRPEEYALRYPIGADTILSPKANGQHELRDLSYVGNPDETCRVSSAGDVVYFPNVNGQRLAWPLVE